MDYLELEKSYNSLWKRYTPRLDAVKRVRAALLSFGNDPRGTSEEKAALESLITSSRPKCDCVGCMDNWDTVETFKYQWCNVCKSMVSDNVVHKHCPSCNNPVTKPQRCGLCPECCGKEVHATCAVCGIHGKIKKCDHCQSCDKCCACVKCDTCGDRVACTCHTTRYGSYTKCSCNKDRKPGQPWTAERPNQRKKFEVGRLAGVEWEYTHAGRNLTPMIKWQARWLGNVVSDASCGLEAVTPPIGGDHLVGCIEQLADSLKGVGAVVDGRCSIHVHVDARDFKWDDMYRFLHVYSIVEPMLYLLGGQERAQGNKYCYHVGHLYAKALSENMADRKEAVLAVALANRGELTTTSEQIKRNARSHMRNVKTTHEQDTRASGRYKGINLIPWLVGKRNKASNTTVEFRLYQGTLNKIDVLEWTKLCVRIVEWCSKATVKDCQKLPASALKTLCLIAPESKAWMLGKVRAWRKTYRQQQRIIKVASNKNGSWKIIK